MDQWCQQRSSYLKLLVDVIDAQLFETVGIKDFEAVNIENADRIGHLSSGAHGSVHTLDDPIKEFVIDCFGKGISYRSRLHDIEWDVIDGASSATSLGLDDARRKSLG
jgi:hypothetical protein